MTPVSLLGVASYLPERVVTNDFFAAGTETRKGMFTAPRTRRHVAPGESAADMIVKAATRLCRERGLDPARDVDALFTNVSVPDQAFTGCGAEVAHRLGAKPRFVVDLHNGGCVAFIYMMELVQALVGSGGVRGALLCNVQNAAGRVFAQEGVRDRSQAPVPGDGAGVGWVAASDASPILSVVHEIHGEFSRDMDAAGDDGRRYWEPGQSPITIRFTEERVASIIERGNRLVPDLVLRACKDAGVAVRDVDLLVTNQPNSIFVRNWHEALELPPERHHDTFAEYGNLFGAALPVNLDDAIRRGKLRPGMLLALGGFAHAGDYAAAAIVRWGGEVAANERHRDG
ncbi:MAG TPA: 3-oxoacyl-[acyl-carrier-protein] synthase III C-terminal domain-containing protein [Polyangiaceae bacterium]|nr:3-oxoacyl-[acyl-carrier-protein] synthase III C-terminal domain-containing protein [Polyangiaceae bacterium]